jgi:hypothetical protein
LAWDVLTLAARLLTAKLTGGISLIPLVGDIRRIAAAIKPLKPVELLVVRSVLRIEREKRKPIGNEITVEAASLQEIAADLKTHDGYDSGQLAALVESLVGAKVLDKIEASGGPFFKDRF